MAETTAANAGSAAIETTINYSVNNGALQVTYPSVAGGPAPTSIGDRERRTVSIADGRGRAEGFDLDREGFALVHHETEVSDFYDDQERARIYEGEVERLLKRVTGASRVVVFDHTLRAEADEMRRAKTVREPVLAAHNDYTDVSGPRRVRDLLPDEADALLSRRFAIVNVWRPVSVPAASKPLAVCDAQSIAPGDIIISERRTADRIGYTQRLAYNPDHRWTYFPSMRPDEALLIKCYDSETDGRARFAAHTAIEDPLTPADAPPRQSIETRTFVFY